MKGLLIGCTILVITIVAVFLFSAIIPAVNYARTEEAYTIEKIEKAGGPENVLADCSKLIKMFPISKNDAFHVISPGWANLPASIKALEPQSVTARKGHVVVWFPEKGRRMGITAFDSKLKEYGTRKIINRLWFWNGTPSPETKEAYQSYRVKTENN